MIFVIIISFVLDSLTSNLLMLSSYLYPLFSLMSMVIIYPYLKKRETKKYYFLCVVLGFFYDLLYTNTLFLNTIFFLLLALLTKMLYNLINHTIYSTVCISIFMISLYRLGNYLVFLLIGYIDLNLKLLFRSIYSSLLLNIIYVVLFYYSVRFINKKQLK